MVPSAAPRARLDLLRCQPWAAIQVHEVGQQGAAAGPYDAQADAEEVGALPRMSYSHMVYACLKPGA